MTVPKTWLMGRAEVQSELPDRHHVHSGVAQVGAVGIGPIDALYVSKARGESEKRFLAELFEANNFERFGQKVGCHFSYAFHVRHFKMCIQILL